MTMTKSANLVLEAEKARPTTLTATMESFPSLRKGMANDSAAVELLLAFSPWARALNEANLYITVDPEEVSAAEEAYKQVAQLLVDKLHWPSDTISISPQGSASTRTLIRAPFGNEKFDIDAVCRVDISRVHTNKPMEFFHAIGDALKEIQAEAKKRCWNIPFPNEPFYLEFTPSVPLINVPKPALESMAPRYRSVSNYQETALAVVDTPTKGWKTSNPAGMTKWVEDTAGRNLIRQIVLATEAFHKAAADVAPVPIQHVEITDTLRVAIRLFKRHRDMCVRRNIISAETKPISIIIVTLLTGCYEGLADLGRIYDHPVEVLTDIVSLMPHLVLKLDGHYRVDNPTVEGENFAEKWNQDDGTRYRTFIVWCQTLSADLKTILASKEPEEIAKRVREVFGIPARTNNGGGVSSVGYSAPPPTRSGRGLA